MNVRVCSMNIVDLVQSQVIASVKREKDIHTTILSNATMIFLMKCDFQTTMSYADLNKEANKTVFIHIDFIDGLANTKSAIQYIKDAWKPDGMITTKSNLIKYARRSGLMTIQRLFLIDRSALKKGLEIAHHSKPDAIEVLP